MPESSWSNKFIEEMMEGVDQKLASDYEILRGELAWGLLNFEEVIVSL